MLRVRPVLLVNLHVGAIGLGSGTHVERHVAAIAGHDGIGALGKLVLPRHGRGRGRRGTNGGLGSRRGAGSVFIGIRP